jgi:hypothetical protein
VVHRIGEAFVALETLDEEGLAVAVEGPGDPDGQGDADRQVQGVGDLGVVRVHVRLPFPAFAGVLSFLLFLSQQN